jgi:hypothetical protein
MFQIKNAWCIHFGAPRFGRHAVEPIIGCVLLPGLERPGEAAVAAPRLGWVEGRRLWAGD